MRHLATRHRGDTAPSAADPRCGTPSWSAIDRNVGGVEGGFRHITYTIWGPACARLGLLGLLLADYAAAVATKSQTLGGYTGMTGCNSVDGKEKTAFAV